MISPYTESILIFAGINIIMALSFYLPFSAGMLSLAQAGFMGIGAYTSAVLTTRFGVPFWPALLAGSILATLLSILVGFPALRIKGVYLLLMTLGFSEIVRVFFLNFEYTGAASGLGGIPDHTKLKNLYPVIIVLAIFFHRLTNSRVGRAFEAIKEDEGAAEVMGVNLTRMKLLAFGTGAFIAGLGGAFYAHYALYIDSTMFGVLRSIDILIFALFGGMETFWGSFFGGFLLTFLPEWLRVIQEYRIIIYGGLLILLMIIRPKGILAKEMIRANYWVSCVVTLKKVFAK